MAILDRVSQLVRANVNDLIDRAEDPEKMLDQILRDMQSNITQARAQVASMIAQEKELEADFNQTQQLSGEWHDKATRAVTAGKDDLAREALRRQRDNDESSKLYAQQLDVQKQAVEKLKEQLRLLESKYQSTLSQRDTLVARQRRAQATKEVAQHVSVLSPLDPSAELDRMERKIRSNEAQAAAITEIGDTSYDAQFRELGDADIEQELQALKARAGQGESAGALSSGADATETADTTAETSTTSS